MIALVWKLWMSIVNLFLVVMALIYLFKFFFHHELYAFQMFVICSLCSITQITQRGAK